MEEAINSAVEKIVEFAKNKKEKVVTWDEVTPLLGQDFVNSPEMEAVLKTLSEKKIQLIETGIIGIDDQEDSDDEDDIMEEIKRKIRDDEPLTAAEKRLLRLMEE